MHEALAKGGRLRGIVAAGAGSASRKETRRAHRRGQGRRGGRPDLGAPRERPRWEGQGAKAIGAETLAKHQAAEGDLLVAVPGTDAVTSPALHAVRTLLIRRPGVDAGRRRTPSAGWWTFRCSSRIRRRASASSRIIRSRRRTRTTSRSSTSDPFRCRALHYDAVYNGNELGSGSIRITDPALQQRVFGLLGIARTRSARRFGFLLDGAGGGAPPHGGFAIGFDRVAMLLAGAPVAARRDRVSRRPPRRGPCSRARRRR